MILTIVVLGQLYEFEHRSNHKSSTKAQARFTLHTYLHRQSPRGHLEREKMRALKKSKV